MDYLIHIITKLGYLGYVVLFLIIFLESFPVTFFLPGDSLLFLTGFLASQGHFNIILLITTFFVAGLLGYILSYAVGEKLRNFILNSKDRYWFKIKHLHYTEQFYKKYGDKTLIIGRFVPIVRSFSATLAGSVEMPYRKFIRDTIIGGLFWSIAMTLLGFYLGRIIPNANIFITPIILSIVGVSLLPAIIEFLEKKYKK